MKASIHIHLCFKKSIDPTQPLIDDYLRRLKKYSTIQIHYHSKFNTLRDVNTPDFTHYFLVIQNNSVSSHFFKDFFTYQPQSKSIKSTHFWIGGADGLPQELFQLKHHKISFGNITMPHRLAFLILCEQIYRGAQIAIGSPYHRD